MLHPAQDSGFRPWVLTSPIVTGPASHPILPRSMPISSLAALPLRHLRPPRDLSPEDIHLRLWSCGGESPRCSSLTLDRASSIRSKHQAPTFPMVVWTLRHRGGTPSVCLGAAAQRKGPPHSRTEVVSPMTGSALLTSPLREYRVRRTQPGVAVLVRLRCCSRLPWFHHRLRFPHGFFASLTLNEKSH